jgi:hypothetical protein
MSLAAVSAPAARSNFTTFPSLSRQHAMWRGVLNLFMGDVSAPLSRSIFTWISEFEFEGLGFRVWVLGFRSSSLRIRA